MTIDGWREIFDTLRRNKLRTFLTALSVAWGIFMLVILLGAGTGLQNNVRHQFRDDAINSLWIWGGTTSRPFRGMTVGRKIKLRNRDFDTLDGLPSSEYSTGRYRMRREYMVSHGDNKGAFDIRATHAEHRYLENTLITKGRFLNPIDIAQRRKVAVIGQPVATQLFGRESAIGDYIKVGHLLFRVVGIFDDAGGEGERRKIYIPISTGQMAFSGRDRVHQIMFTVGDADMEQSKRIAQRVRTTVGRAHRFDPADPRALRIRNNVEQFQQINRVFDMIRIFIWIIGLGTIVAGIVGIGNIMLISVKERTKEIGVRKALGASSASIVAMVLQEAVAVTAVAGYAGLVAGVAVLELVGRYMPENDFLRDPEVDLSTALTATVILIVAGAVAGFFPARRAAAVNPVVALRDE